MSFGLQTWDAAQNPVVELNSQTARLITSFNPMDIGATGSYSHPQMGVLIIRQGGPVDFYYTRNGNTLSWFTRTAYTQHSGSPRVTVLST